MKKGLLVVLAVVILGAIATLFYGRSKVQPDGTLLLTSRAPLAAADERAFDRIVSADGLRAWWLGPLGGVEASPKWPRPGERMTFLMGKSPVTYVSTACDRPRKLVAQAAYPDGSSVVTQEFLGAAEGGPAYRKTVVITVKPGTSAAGKWFLGAIVGISVPFEVKRAAAFANKP